jgi:hypothetical protein
MRRAVPDEGRIHLARAEEQSPTFRGVLDAFAVVGLRYQPFKMRVAGEGGERRASDRMTEERLAEEKDES